MWNTLNTLANDPIKQELTFHSTDEKIAPRGQVTCARLLCPNMCYKWDSNPDTSFLYCSFYTASPEIRLRSEFKDKSGYRLEVKRRLPVQVWQ